MSKYVLSDIFKGDYPISQYFSQRPEYYSQFGFAGHEGVDWATPVGTPITAPFDGRIVQDNDPKDGVYGNYVVLWDYNQKCAVWFCHLDLNNVSIGDVVKKGQVLGKTGNSGNTSGPHLHFNFCETDSVGNRINKNNGYKGFLNVLNPILVEWKMGVGTEPPQNPVFQFSDQTHIPGNFLTSPSFPVPGDYLELQQIRGLLGDLGNCQKENEGFKAANNQQANMIADLEKQLKECQSIPTSPYNPPKTALGKLFDRLVRIFG